MKDQDMHDRSYPLGMGSGDGLLNSALIIWVAYVVGNWLDKQLLDYPGRLCLMQFIIHYTNTAKERILNWMWTDLYREDGGIGPSEMLVTMYHTTYSSVRHNP